MRLLRAQLLRAQQKLLKNTLIKDANQPLTDASVVWRKGKVELQFMPLYTFLEALLMIFQFSLLSPSSFSVSVKIVPFSN